MKQGIGFQGQLVPGKMCRLQAVAVAGHSVPGSALSRQAEHQVEVEIVKAGIARGLGGTARLAVIMYASEVFQQVVAENSGCRLTGG